MTKKQAELIKDMEREATAMGDLVFGEIEMLRRFIAGGCSDAEIKLMTRDRFTREAVMAFKSEFMARQNANAIQL